MTLNYLIIGKRIKEARKKKHLSQAQLCELVGLSNGYISYIETASKGVSLDALVRIANALNVTADELLAENLLTNRQICLNGELPICSVTAMHMKEGFSLKRQEQ